MKPSIRILFGTVAACCLALHAGAQNQNQNVADENRTRDRDDVGFYHRLPRLGRVMEARKLIGREVRDSQDQKLGRIKDMAIDLEAGRIAEVLIATGGPGDVDGRMFAVPPDLFRTEEPNSFVRVSLDKAKLEAAPVFDYGRWGQSIESARVAEVYRYYNIRPWFIVQGQMEVNHMTQPTEQLGYLKPASRLMEMPARNLNFDRLGKVENVAIDLQAGRVVEIIIATGGFLGIGDELCAVPPQALQYNSDYSQVLLDTSRDALKAAPHFTSHSWAQAGQPGYVTAVYRFYKVEPYFSTEVDSAAQNVREHASKTDAPAPAPANQGNDVKPGSDPARPNN
jgi:sporulation protein YlmC with PRC-barrel domain